MMSLIGGKEEMAIVPDGSDSEHYPGEEQGSAFSAAKKPAVWDPPKMSMLTSLSTTCWTQSSPRAQFHNLPWLNSNQNIEFHTKRPRTPSVALFNCSNIPNSADV